MKEKLLKIIEDNGYEIQYYDFYDEYGKLMLDLILVRDYRINLFYDSEIKDILEIDYFNDDYEKEEKVMGNGTVLDITINKKGYHNLENITLENILETIEDVLKTFKEK